ncbi:MAG: hypothetical protein NPIRA02_40970 [Nitrospirales bacterium]|nr:MAG: hypothetical protein NPIRA02_40970 [Nitrospirales bacterium]
MFRSLVDVLEVTAEWMTIYNEHRPYDALQGEAPCTYRNPKTLRTTCPLVEKVYTIACLL